MSMQQNNDFISFMRENKDARHVACILANKDHISRQSISMKHQMGARAEILTRNEKIEVFSPVPHRFRLQEYKRLTYDDINSIITIPVIYLENRLPI